MRGPALCPSASATSSSTSVCRGSRPYLARMLEASFFMKPWVTTIWSIGIYPVANKNEMPPFPVRSPNVMTMGTDFLPCIRRALRAEALRLPGYLEDKVGPKRQTAQQASVFTLQGHVFRLSSSCRMIVMLDRKVGIARKGFPMSINDRIMRINYEQALECIRAVLERHVKKARRGPSIPRHRRRYSTLRTWHQNTVDGRRLLFACHRRRTGE